ncbi:MAG: cbb3-type cytochrome c oxidase subunit 3 [Aestuariivirga sp.]|uniref:cbb3-type cytochrome c oxidase subunit 3 n=1 Tax=Aestuariivirga sp. TaxID=2650926 RepID=UPI0025B7E721|nr:cbb3-type cytochrome c oxidase subunit 3 [Aestuariivirga sp.]MCA3560462.1 cbb3-type cytochrome c oxidase subunit 3 [Aestuariivirga sp.]
MEHYTLLRQLADSWGLVAMFLFFIGAIVFVFRPGSKAEYERLAKIPLDNGSED